MAKTPKQEDERDEIVIDEAAKRKGDAGLLRALRTPPKPRGKGLTQPQGSAPDKEGVERA